MVVIWQQIGNLSVLTPDEAETIRASSLRILEIVGVQVQDPTVRDIFKSAGAREDGNRVYLPPKVLMDALACAPSEVIFYSRDGRTIASTDNWCYHGPAPSAVAVLEYGTNERHTSTYQDVADLTRLCDALPGLDFISPPAIAQDCPPAHSGLRTTEAVFCNTAKFCLVFALNWAEAEAWITLAEIAADGNIAERPTIGFAISPTSPLVLAKETSDILVGVARRGLPIVTVPGGMAGATTPITILGTLVVEHAEALLALALAQIIRPGTPCVHGLASAVMDMETGNISLAKPERTLLLNAVAPLARAWNLPSYAPVGLSDTFTVDAQYGGEKMLSFVTNLAAGLNFSSGVGRMEAGISTSYEGILIDHELLQMTRRYLRGIRVDAEALAEEIITRVGPAGNFLTDEHTLHFLRSDEYAGLQLCNRQGRYQGGRTILERAHDQVQKILGEHLLPVAVDRQVAFHAAIDERIKRI